MVEICGDTFQRHMYVPSHTHSSTHACMYTDTKMHPYKYPIVYFFHPILTDIILISFETLTIYPPVHTSPYPMTSHRQYKARMCVCLFVAQEVEEEEMALL